MTTAIEFIEINWKNTSLWEFLYIHKFVPKGYEEFFRDEKVKEIIKGISDKLKEECKEKQIFPRLENVFKAFYYTPVPKVVLLGQDPYATITDIGTPTARGLSFSVIGKFLNPSLKNIQKEVESCGFKVNHKSGDLSKWAKQGVLLLNSALTVEPQNSGVHVAHWAPFTESLIRWLTNKYELTFLMWGLDAQAYESDIQRKDKQTILKSSHPSPYSALKPCGSNPPFIGCKHFSQVQGIDWSI